MAKGKAKLKPEANYRLVINGHELSGVKYGGRWTFACGSWPDLVDAHNGCADASDIIEAFTRRALGEADQGDQQKASA